MNQLPPEIFATARELNLNRGQTATAAEVNLSDVSYQTETITSGAISVRRRITKIAFPGAGAATLAAPDPSMLGAIKVVVMSVDNGDVTLSLTNVTGGSAATTCTFNDINDTLTLVGGLNKWHVLGEAGVVLT
jgi:hypothetical protein